MTQDFDFNKPVSKGTAGKQLNKTHTERITTALNKLKQVINADETIKES